MLIKTENDRSGAESAGFAGQRLHERGIALVLVLWLTLVLSVVAVSVVRVAQGQVRIAFNVQEAAKAEALADGGFYLAIAAVMKARSADPWPIDGTARNIVIADEMVTISIRDEAVKANLNSASDEVLAATLMSSGVDEQTASEIAGALVVERQRRMEAAKASAGRRSLVRPGQFFTIRELQKVAGLNRPEYLRLRDFFTVYGARRARLGTSGPVARLSAIPSLAHEPDGAQPRSSTNTYSIRSSVRLPSGAGYERFAVVRLRAGGIAGYQVLHWD